MTDVSNKTFLIKSSPTFPTTDLSTHKTFSSGDSTFSQLTIYSDGEIWYGNDTVAYGSGTWEIEYRYLTFGANQQMDDSDYAKFLQVYEEFVGTAKKLYFRIGQNGEYKLGSVNGKIKGVWGGTPFDNTPTPTGETWVINATLFDRQLSPTSINFVSNNQTFSVIGAALAESPFASNYITYYGNDTYTDVASGTRQTFAWSNQAYRTVTFETPPTGALLIWLQANAVKQ